MIQRAAATGVSALLASLAAAVSIHKPCTATQVSTPLQFSIPPAPQELKSPPMMVTNISQ